MNLIQNKGKLLDLARKKLDDDGYNYVKKRSRSKTFGSEQGIEEDKVEKKVQRKPHQQDVKRIKVTPKGIPRKAVVRLYKGLKIKASSVYMFLAKMIFNLL